MPLKIAFLISGQARNYIYTTFSFKKFVFNYSNDADIYISFKKNSRNMYSKEEINKKIIPQYQIPIDDNITDKTYLSMMFGENLKYFGYDDEEYIQKIIKEKLDSLSSIDSQLKKDEVISTLDQYARVKNIAEIFERVSSKKYDIIVRLRLDKLWWVSKLEIEKYIIDKTKIYFSYIDFEHKSMINGLVLPNWIQDFFFMGNTDLVLYVMKDFFDKLYTMNKKMVSHNSNNAPEIQLGYYINLNNYITPYIIPSNINKNLCSLGIRRKLYLDGYFVGTYNDVYKSLKIYFKFLKQNQSYV